LIFKMKQLVGFEIKVRGPFDISKRLTSDLSLPSSNRYREISPKHILLNPLSKDGCWDVLFMIAGGTGLTPMLQLVSLITISFYIINYLLSINFFIFIFFADKIPFGFC